MTFLRLVPAVLAVTLLCSCASSRMAPQFSVPSTAPIHQSVAKVGASVGQAQTHVEKAIDIVKTLPCKNDAAVVALSTELFNAKIELQTAQTDNTVLEGEVTQHDEQLKQQTALANNVSAAYNTTKPRLDAAVAKYHRLKTWFCWEGAALTFLALLRFGFLIPPPYKYIAFVALPAAIYGVLWLWL